MITYYFLYAWTGILNGIAATIYALPDATIPTQFSAWLATTGGYLAIATKFLPLTIAALLIAIGMMLAVENADGIFKVVKWVYSKIPGIS